MIGLIWYDSHVFYKQKGVKGQNGLKNDMPKKDKERPK